MDSSKTKYQTNAGIMGCRVEYEEDLSHVVVTHINCNLNDAKASAIAQILKYASVYSKGVYFHRDTMDGIPDEDVLIERGIDYNDIVFLST